MSTISIIGSGISGLSAACFAARDGHDVAVFEQNSTIGGRARQYSAEGFTYDMGPSWYWMPDIFEQFFNQFGKTTADYYQLVQLDPGFRIFFNGEAPMDIPANYDELNSLFEQIEPGSSKALKKYMADAEFKYTDGMMKLAYKPALSWMEFADISLLMNMSRLKMFTPISKHVRQHFKDKRLIALMEFPVLFLGAMPNQVPALYSLMNYAALKQGTWYPMGGMYKIIEGMHELATSLGVKFHLEHAVEQIEVAGNRAKRIRTSKGTFDTDAVIATGDYHHVEQALLKEDLRNYPAAYWDKKTFAPSCLIFYVGLNKKIPNLQHHNLFFDTDFDQHAKEIYENPAWPKAPLFYVCCPSKTDDSVAPEGRENLFILMPVATGLEDSKELQAAYYDMLIARIEQHCGEKIKENVVYMRPFSVNDFKKDYNAYKGNAYGLANTLRQTAVLKPRAVNKKVSNLFYAGQLTVPGPGVPPSLISGQIASELMNKYLKKERV